MADNVHRGTAAKLLLVFAALIVVAALFTLRIRRANIGNTEFLTAIEDVTYFDHHTGLVPGSSDFENPNLVFGERPEGIFRRRQQLYEMPDWRMILIGRDETHGLNVYSAAVRRPGKKHGLAPLEERKYWLKADKNRYIEFGERKSAKPNSGEAPEPAG